MKRIITFTLVVMAVWALETWWLNSRQANTSTTFALQQLDGSNADATRLRQFEAGKNIAPVIAGAATLLAAWLCFGKLAKAPFNKIKARVLKTATLAMGVLCLTRLT